MNATQKNRTMPIERIVTVGGKELTDVLRDRRTMLLTLLMAMAAGPLFLALILNMAANQAETTPRTELRDLLRHGALVARDSMRQLRSLGVEI